MNARKRAEEVTTDDLAVDIDTQDTVPDEREGTVQPRNTPPQSLEPRKQNQGALRAAQPDPVTTLTRDDVIMPKLKISQAMSKVNKDDLVRQGNWYHTTRNDNLGKKVTILPVGLRKSRSMFKQGEGVICRSYDMRQGEGTPGILCEGTPEEIETLPADERGCPFRLWQTDPETKRRIPPPCQEAYNYPVLILDPEDMESGRTRRAIVTFRATSVQAAKQINSEILESDTEWVDNIFEISLVDKQNSRGSFYVPVAQFVKESSGRVREKAKEFATSVNAKSVRESLERDEDD